jgi:hypothetical protein
MEEDDRQGHWEPRPIMYIPRALLPEPPKSGCALQLTLRDGRVIKGVGVDMTGLIYGVLVKEEIDSRLNPLDFSAEDIVAVERIDLAIQPGYKLV